VALATSVAVLLDGWAAFRQWCQQSWWRHCTCRVMRVGSIDCSMGSLEPDKPRDRCCVRAEFGERPRRRCHRNRSSRRRCWSAPSRAGARAAEPSPESRLDDR
jgi:hypothetical protein